MFSSQLSAVPQGVIPPEQFASEPDALVPIPG
jgi:hypothetical protein